MLSCPRSGACGLRFSVEQARAEWLPDDSNLRWGTKGCLESLFFLEIASPRELKGVLLKADKGNKRFEFSLGDIPAGVAERELWLPVTPKGAMRLSLYEGEQLLAEDQREIEIKEPLWWKLNLKLSVVDPLDYGYALLPKVKVLIERGRNMEVELEIVGLTAGIETVNFLLEIKAEERPEEVFYKTEGTVGVSFLKRSTWTESVSTETMPTRKYTLNFTLEGSQGARLGELRRELILIEPKRIRRRFAAVYTDLKYDFPVILSGSDLQRNQEALFKELKELMDEHNKGEVSEDKYKERRRNIERMMAEIEGRLARGDKRNWEDLLPHFGPFSDVVVSFEGKPYKWVFWRGASYVPVWALDGVWFCYEWVETYGHRLPQDADCVEPIIDRECRYSRVRIIDSTPARVIVHWRYAESGFRYSICDDEWVDEYYYLYPDTVGVRKIMGWILKGSWHETNEFITILPPGAHPRDALELPISMTIMDLNGNELNLSYPNPWRDWDGRWSSFSEGKDSFIFRQNLKDRPKPFISVRKLSSIYSLWTGRNREDPWLGCWHWPVTRGIHTLMIREPWQFKEGPTHWCLFDIAHEPIETKDLGDNRELKVWAHLLGLTDGIDPVEMTKSWLTPAKIDVKNGLKYIDYNITQRSYLFKKLEGGQEFAFTLLPQQGIAQVNPVFVISGLEDEAKVHIELNGKTLPEQDFRCGFEPQPDGVYKLVVWLNKRIKEPVTVRIFLSTLGIEHAGIAATL